MAEDQRRAGMVFSYRSDQVGSDATEAKKLRFSSKFGP